MAPHALGPIVAGLEPMTTGQSLIGPYRIAHFDCESYGLLTNKCPQGSTAAWAMRRGPWGWR